MLEKNFNLVLDHVITHQHLHYYSFLVIQPNTQILSQKSLKLTFEDVVKHKHTHHILVFLLDYIMNNLFTFNLNQIDLL